MSRSAERATTHVDVLTLERDSPIDQLARAAELLERCAGAVVVEGLVVLRATEEAILCEVIDPTPSAHRCAEEYRVMIENAARCLERSGISRRLPDRPLRWLVSGIL